MYNGREPFPIRRREWFCGQPWQRSNGSFAEQQSCPRDTKDKSTNYSGYNRALLSVFEVLSRHDLSLRDFLLASFEYQHEVVVNKVSKFYFNEGPSVIISLWAQKLDLGKYDAPFARTVIGVVGDRFQADLDNAFKEPYFRHPANSVDRKSIKAFSLRRIRDSLDKSASHLTLLLEGLLPTSDGDYDEFSVKNWKPRDFAAEETVSAPRKKKVAWLSTRHDSDANSTSSSTSSSISAVNGGLDENAEAEADLDWEQELDPKAFDLDEDVHAEPDSDWEQELDPKVIKHHTNAFVVTVASLHLRGLSIAKRLIRLLSRIGLSVSYNTTTRCLKSLAGDNLRLVRSVARKKAIIFLYDNFNRQNTHRHQQKDKPDFFESATTGTIVVGEHLGEERLPDPIPVASRVSDVMLQLPGTLHNRRVVRYHLLTGILGVTHNVFMTTFNIPVIRQLDAKRTEAYELPAMPIDQASVKGNIQVLNSMNDTLQLAKGSFRTLKMIIAGDHLTISRILTIQEQSIGEATYFNQMRWAIPVLQLFHMQMILCSSILSTHFGHVSQPGSMAAFLPLLSRRKLNKDMPCYYTADEFLRVIFRAMVTRRWNETTKAHGSHQHSTADVVFEQQLNSIVNELIEPSTQLFDSFSTTNANAILFLRDMTVYIEFCASIKAGDVGRIEEILKRITIMFQAGNNRNYGLELLRLSYNIRHVWGATRKDAISSSFLMNTKGLKNHFIPGDLYQEHNNLLTKQTHAAIGNKWSTMSYITPNIRFFREISSKIEDQFNLPSNSSFHRQPTMAGDIRHVMRFLGEHDILGEERRPIKHQEHPYTTIAAVDLMAEGVRKLVHGGYSKFL
ncbi:hypothetical protein KVV02_008337 [Mortierella alpina]|uniref:DUF6589 domain-containing protein n=1 Tax=Mortierella alpina TaxID=64518 RepID=A0A9P7ZW13_MORAP|nr:hypothetical protein KVV02_008337 [Mortierella alpina]